LKEVLLKPYTCCSQKLKTKTYQILATFMLQNDQHPKA